MKASSRALALVLGLCGLVALQRRLLEPEASETRRLRDPAFLPDGQKLRAASLGQRHLLADYYWLNFVQYVGESELAKVERWDALFPLGQLITDLDPRFGYAYQEIGSLLSSVGQVEASNRLLEKGMAAIPDRWQLPWNLGFNKLFYEHDFRAASAYYRRAGEVSGRPHLINQAASIAADGGDGYDVAIAIVEEGLKQAGSDFARDLYNARLAKLYCFKLLAQLEEKVKQYTDRRGHLPDTLQRLVEAGLIRAVPDDPAGGTFVIDRSTGVVRSTAVGERKPFLNAIVPP